jgi:hypothetical protein
MARKKRDDKKALLLALGIILGVVIVFSLSIALDDRDVRFSDGENGKGGSNSGNDQKFDCSAKSNPRLPQGNDGDTYCPSPLATGTIFPVIFKCDRGEWIEDDTSTKQCKSRIELNRDSRITSICENVINSQGNRNANCVAKTCEEFARENNGRTEICLSQLLNTDKNLPRYRVIYDCIIDENLLLVKDKDQTLKLHLKETIDCYGEGYDQGDEIKGECVENNDGTTKCVPIYYT